MACAKHFPGHGDTSKDSHFDLPFVKKSLDELRDFELQPFLKASKARVEFIMMAHLVVDAIDKEKPCTLSPEAYSFLRETLKYKKIIISDDMEMKAISDRYSYGEAAIMALDAGADMLCYRSMETCREAYEACKLAIPENKLNRQKVGEKIDRIKDCKKRFLSEYKPIYIPNINKAFKNDRYQELLDQIR